MTSWAFAPIAVLAVLLSACGGGGGSEPTPVPTPASTPTPGPLWSDVAPLRDVAAQAGRMIGAAVFSSRLAPTRATPARPAATSTT